MVSACPSPASLNKPIQEPSSHCDRNCQPLHPLLTPSKTVLRLTVPLRPLQPNCCPQDREDGRVGCTQCGPYPWGPGKKLRYPSSSWPPATITPRPQAPDWPRLPLHLPRQSHWHLKTSRLPSALLPPWVPGALEDHGGYCYLMSLQGQGTQSVHNINSKYQRIGTWPQGRGPISHSVGASLV